MTVKRGLTVATILSAVAVLAGGGAAIAAPGGPAAASCTYPADVLDLHNWYEGLPIGEAENPKNVKQPELATYRADPWFTTTADCTGVRFRAAVNGVTTSGSGYPRSELRETDGSKNANWSSTSGTHTMVVKEAITHLPEDKNQVVAGQIHGSDDDLTVFRLEGGNLYVTKGDDTHYKLVTSTYQLGTEFEAKYVVSGGKVKAYYNGTLQTTISQKFSGAYFKAGAYTQANCDKSAPCSDANYGEVVIHALTVTHTN
ncbi:polysaccharide lyase family 7 protein [Amycolatopsis sp. NBC_01286]|uniref:polysaccharide lyase family 7 protein n=1 Tax=Amycolatopsis sp. NBC_01286 TaxID=2903560 RepID=UPI002E11BD0F|nr:polysaccharide lyase family 7 protein [Amycolatopsis sp. NBC_01286]